MQMLWDTPSQSPLDESIAGLPALSGKGAAPAAQQTTKLANGITVTSEDRHGSVRAAAESAAAAAAAAAPPPPPP